ncbi:hypothetical protein BT69DRAFT_1352347 [Atractiella rhizophila]|nr:hypothetical protein BT69DRAFT_1352347 [Atractiella rhizophila]
MSALHHSSSKGPAYAMNLTLARQQGLWALSHPADSKGRLVTLPPRHRKRDYILGVFRQSEKTSEKGGLGAELQREDSLRSLSSVGPGGREKEESAQAGWTWEECGRKVRKWVNGSEAMVETALAEQVIQSLLLQAANESKPRYSPARSHLSEFSASSPPSEPVWPPHILSKDQSAAKEAKGRLKKALSGSPAGEPSFQTRAVLALAEYATGDLVACSEVLNESGFENWVDEFKADDAPSKGKRKEVNVGWENVYGYTLRVAAAALKAFCLDRDGKKEEALKAYERMAQIYIGLTTALQKEDLSTWEEFKRWAEEGLYRYALLSKEEDDFTALTAHRCYFQQCSSLGSDYRLQKRSVVFRSYYRLLIDAYRRGSYIPSMADTTSPLVEKLISSKGNNADSPEVQRTPASPRSTTMMLQESTWRLEVEKLVTALEQNLKTWTKFPKAGDINRPYLEFLDLCVESWELGGRAEDVAVVVSEIMLAALQYTFHSNRLLRHLVKAQLVSKKYDACIRSVNLYVQLWTKAKETKLEEVAKTISRLHEAYSRREAAEKGEEFDEEDENLRGDESDVDSNRDFVETVLIGLRVYLKYLRKFQEADELMKKLEKALDDFECSDVKQDKKLMSRVTRTRGIVDGALAEIGDKSNRAGLQQSCLKHLSNAATLHMSFANLYHLAFAQTEFRDIDSAILSIKRALQLSTKNKDAWHLLALLMSAKHDYEGALKIIDATTEDDDESSDDDDDRSPTPNGTGANGAGARGATPVEESAPEEEEVNTGWDHLMDAEGLLASEMQLRMTRNILVELIGGPEAAIQDQKTMFSYFSRINSPLQEPKSYPYSSQPMSAEQSTTSNVQLQHSNTTTSRQSRTSIAPATSTGDQRGQTDSASLQPEASISASLHPSGPTSEDNRSFVVAPLRPVDSGMKKLLINLWLLSAATFRRAGKTEDCRGAIKEAEAISSEDVDVIVQQSLLHYANGDYEATYKCLRESSVLEVDHPDSIFFLAKLYLESVPPLEPTKHKDDVIEDPYVFPTNNLNLRHARDYAETMLELATETNAWDYPEMWWLLGRVIRRGNQRVNSDGYIESVHASQSRREVQALQYALDLENTKPVRRLRESVPRIL